MKIFSILCTIALIGCATTQPEKEVVLCFQSQDEAATMGMKIFNDHFTERARYWLDGTNQDIKGLGLQWRDLINSDYCQNNQFPLVVIYDPPNGNEFSPQKVIDAGKLTAKLLLKEYRAL